MAQTMHPLHIPDAHGTAILSMDVNSDRAKSNDHDFKFKEDDIFANVVSFLTLPLQLESSSSQNNGGADNCFALCPWCDCASEHVFVGKGFLRKDEYRCSNCCQRTSTCIRFCICGNASKSTIIWDDQFCEACDRDVQRLGAGEISLDAFLDQFRGSSGSSNISVKKLECGDAETSKHQVRTDILRPSVSATDLESTSASRSVSSAPAVNHTQTPCSDSVMKGESIEAEYFDEAEESASSNDDSYIAQQPAELFQVETDSEDLDPAESWMAVRDAVLFWPGPERKDVDKYRELCSHKCWIQRWIESCQGDEVWAIKRILAHLKWRQSYGLDNIMDEDWAAMDARGEMYVSGVDKAGCPTWTWRAHMHDASLSTPEKGARYLICIMERTWAVNPTADRISVICDCTNLAFGNYEHKMFLISLDILSEQYPDHLKMTFMFPVSWALYTVVAVGKNFFDAQTASKILVMRDDDIRTALHTHFHHDQIEPRFGGTLSLPAAARRRMLEEDPAAMRAWQAETARARRGGLAPVAGAEELVRRVLPPREQHFVAGGLVPYIPDRHQQQPPRRASAAAAAGDGVRVRRRREESVVVAPAGGMLSAAAAAEDFVVAAEGEAGERRRARPCGAAAAVLEGRFEEGEGGGVCDGRGAEEAASGDGCSCAERGDKSREQAASSPREQPSSSPQEQPSSLPAPCALTEDSKPAGAAEAGEAAGQGMRVRVSMASAAALAALLVAARILAAHGGPPGAAPAM